MKKIFCYSLLMALVILTGCRNEEELFGQKIDGNYQVNAQLESRADSRTAVNEANQVLWLESDKIGVYGDKGSSNVAFSIGQISDEGASATFIGDLEEGEVATTAYYPYDETATLSGNQLTFTLPAEYDYTENSNAPMIGVKQENGNFLFKHLCGLLKFSIMDIPADAARLIVASRGDAAPLIAGSCVVDDITANGAVFSIKEGFDQIVINMDGITGTQTFYVPIPVGSYPEIQVTLEKQNGTTCFSEKLSDVSVRRATIVRVSDDLANIDQSVNEYIQASIDKDIVTFFSELDQLLVQNENISEYNLSISGCEITYKDESQQLIVFSYDNSESSDPSTPIEEEPTYSWIADIPEIDDFTLVSSTETCATTDDNIFQNTKIVRWAPFQTELGTGWNYSELLETSPLNLTVIGNYTNQEATFSSLMDNLSQAGIIDIETHGCQGKYIILPEKNMDGNVYKQIGSSIIVYFGSSDQVESVSEKNIGIPITTFERYSYVEDGILFNNSCESSQGSLGQAFIDKGISTYAGYTNIINTSGVQRFMNSYTSKLLCDLKSNNESIPDDLTYSGSSMDKKEDGTFEFIHIEGYFDVTTSKEMRFVDFEPEQEAEVTETEISFPFYLKGVRNLKDDCKVRLLISDKNEVDEEITNANIKNYATIKPHSIGEFSDNANYYAFKGNIEHVKDDLDESGVGSTGTKYYWICLEYKGRYWISDEYGTFALPSDGHPHMIDLGLSSGTKWACCNMGSSVPEDLGEQYAIWEEISKLSSDDEEWGEIWTGDGFEISETRYDIARKEWGSDWRLPTYDDWKELINECEWECFETEEIAGIKVVGPNKNYILLPGITTIIEMYGIRTVTFEGEYCSSSWGEWEDFSGAAVLSFLGTGSNGYTPGQLVVNWASGSDSHSYFVRPVSDK